MFRELTQQRGEVLELMTQFRSSSDEVREGYRKYISSLTGFKKAIDEGGKRAVCSWLSVTAVQLALVYTAQAAAGEGTAVPESRKLTHATVFKWSDNVSLKIESEPSVAFEMDNITLNMGIWLMKHAAWVVEYADTSADGDGAAKDIFNSLKASIHSHCPVARFSPSPPMQEAAGIFRYFLQRSRSEIAYAPNTGQTASCQSTKVTNRCLCLRL